MFTFVGYKQQVHRADLGWDVADENGRGGKLIGVRVNPDGYQTLTVEPKLDTTLKDQITIELREHEVSFTHPPDAAEVA